MENVINNLNLKQLHTKWPPFKKPSSVLDLRSWLCDVRLVEKLGPLPPDIQTENNENNIEHKNIPSWGGKGFNPGSINLFITICDYEEEKEKKIRNPFLNAVCPQGIPRNKFQKI